MAVEHDRPEPNDDPLVVLDRIDWEETAEIFPINKFYRNQLIRQSASEHIDIPPLVNNVESVKRGLIVAGYCVYDGPDFFEILQHFRHRRRAWWKRIFERISW